MLAPVSCGREGRAPLILQLPKLHDEALRLAELLAAAHEQGHAWGDMAILARRHAVLEHCARVLRQRRLPHRLRRRAGSFDPAADTIKRMTMHACKGLEFPVVALAGVGQMPDESDSEVDAARLFYVAATRATQELMVMVSGDGAFARRLRPAAVAA